MSTGANRVIARGVRGGGHRTTCRERLQGDPRASPNLCGESCPHAPRKDEHTSSSQSATCCAGWAYVCAKQLACCGTSRVAPASVCARTRRRSLEPSVRASACVKSVGARVRKAACYLPGSTSRCGHSDQNGQRSRCGGKAAVFDSCSTGGEAALPARPRALRFRMRQQYERT